MPRISAKGSQMPASPIRKLDVYAQNAVKAGLKIYHLNIGQPVIETPAVMLNAVKNADIRVLAYTHSAGMESYRKKLVQYYHHFDIEVTIQDMLVTTGGSEAILIAFMSCLDPGDEIIVPEPFYSNFNGFAHTAGVVIKPIASKIEDGFALPPIETFEQVITPKTKGILICNPNNPTGYLYSEAELQKLKAIVLRHDLYLFVDEVYREFCYDGKKHFSALNLPGLEEHVVLIDSISKRYSACGARIGALVSRNREVMQTALKFAQSRLCPSTYSQIAGEAALDIPPDYISNASHAYEVRRNFIVEALNQIDGVFCPNPGGAFYVIARLPVDSAENFCQWLLESFSYQGQTVMLAPAAGFYATPGRGTNEVRIAYVLTREDLGKAMLVLAEALKQYPGRQLSVSTKAVEELPQ
ncbi:MAG: pyridoxal phosphate-dependent aminotransferase [Bacteroidota bacterium]